MCVKLFFIEQLLYKQTRNTRLPNNNQERRPITIELNLDAVTLCDGESLPVSSYPSTELLALKPHLRSAPLPRNAERTSVEFGFVLAAVLRNDDVNHTW